MTATGVYFFSDHPIQSRSRATANSVEEVNRLVEVRDDLLDDACGMWSSGATEIPSSCCRPSRAPLVPGMHRRRWRCTPAHPTHSLPRPKMIAQCRVGRYARRRGDGAGWSFADRLRGCRGRLGRFLAGFAFCLHYWGFGGHRGCGSKFALLCRLNHAGYSGYGKSIGVLTKSPGATRQTSATTERSPSGPEGRLLVHCWIAGEGR